jgi:hypothetical protein
MDTYRDFLKQMIDKNGFDYLHSNAFNLYNELLGLENVDPRYARVLLLTLLAKVHEQAKRGTADLSTLSKLMQDELFISEHIAN